MSEQEFKELQELAGYRANRVAKLVKAYNEQPKVDNQPDDSAPDFEVDCVVVDMVSDLINYWKENGLSVPELFERVVLVIGEELSDKAELAAIGISVREAVSKLRDKA
jgi:hypothetical protein